MAINLQALMDRVGRELSASGSTYESDFLDACRDVARDLNRVAGQSINPDTMAVGTSLSVDKEYYPAFYEGSYLFLQRLPVYAKKPEINYKVNYDRALAMAQYHYINSQDPAAGMPSSRWGTEK